MTASSKQHLVGRAPRSRAGQTLILVVLLIGGIVIVVTAVSGLLTFYQLQEAGHAAGSTEAILAADAGLERVLRYHATRTGPLPPECESDPPCSFPELSGQLPTGATFQGEIRVLPDPSGGRRIILSATGRDRSGRTVRSLQTVIVEPASP